MDFAWSSKQWGDWIRGTEKFLLLCMFSGELLIGFAVFERSEDSWANLHKIALDKDHRGSGLSDKLLKHGIELLRGHGHESCTLEVREHNRSAVRLYERLGFKSVHKSKNYYSDGSDALKMVCALR